MKQMNQLIKKLFFAISLMSGHYITYATPNDAGNFNDFTARNQASIKEQTIKLSTGVELQYIEEGNNKGATIIFLQCYTDSWHSFEKVLNLFPKQFHVIAISQRGHGNSSK